MKESSPRFQAPMSAPRPHGARLVTAFSPKLGRTVRAFGHAGFEQWIRLGLSYQSVMHQRAGASRCPCHGVALEECCRGCGACMEYRLNAKLLGAPFRCANCRRPFAGWGARLVLQPAPPDLRRAITRVRCSA